MLKDPSVRRGLAVLVVTLVILSLDILFGFGSAARADEAKPLPPRFVPGTFLYLDGRLINVLLGKTAFISQHECMEDVQHSVEKALPSESRKVVGFCLPVPTFDAADLTPPVETERGSL